MQHKSLLPTPSETKNANPPKPRPIKDALAETLQLKKYDLAGFEREIGRVCVKIHKYAHDRERCPNKVELAKLMLKLVKLLQDLNVFNSERLNTEIANDFVSIAQNKLKTPFIPEPTIAGLEFVADWYVDVSTGRAKRQTFVRSPKIAVPHDSKTLLI